MGIGNVIFLQGVCHWHAIRKEITIYWLKWNCNQINHRVEFKRLWILINLDKFHTLTVPVNLFQICWLMTNSLIPPMYIHLYFKNFTHFQVNYDINVIYVYSLTILPTNHIIILPWVLTFEPKSMNMWRTGHFSSTPAFLKETGGIITHWMKFTHMANYIGYSSKHPYVHELESLYNSWKEFPSKLEKHSL